MTQFVIANNVNTQLAAAASSGATTLTLASSTNLPTLSAGQIMPLTLNDAATGQNYEIVYVTAISGVTLTVTRAQEGTGALNWSIGDYAYCAPTAGTVAMTSGNPNDTFQVAASTALTHAPQTGQVQGSAFNYAGLAGGTANAITATLSPAPASYTDYLMVTVRIAATNTGSVSLNVNGLGVVPVIGLGHQLLQGGELFAGGFATFAYSTNYSEAILLECTGGALQIAPATQSQHAAQLGQIGHGQCRLSVASTTSLKLSPYNGNVLVINGVPQTIPAAGVALSNAGLAASTLYYVYAYMNSGTMTLEAVVTSHATGTNGVEIKSGDATRTLVGMIYTNASSQFVDTGSTRFCLNWFNRRKILSNAAPSGPFSFTNTAMAETSTTIRAQFLTWADDIPYAQLAAQATETSGTPSVTQLNYQLFVDGISSGYGPGVGNVIEPTWFMVMSTYGALGALSEGMHYTTLGTYVGTNGGTLAVSNVQNSVTLYG